MFPFFLPAQKKPVDANVAKVWTLSAMDVNDENVVSSRPYHIPVNIAVYLSPITSYPLTSTAPCCCVGNRTTRAPNKMSLSSSKSVTTLTLTLVNFNLDFDLNLDLNFDLPLKNIFKTHAENISHLHLEL